MSDNKNQCLPDENVNSQKESIKMWTAPKIVPLSTSATEGMKSSTPGETTFGGAS